MQLSFDGKLTFVRKRVIKEGRRFPQSPPSDQNLDRRLR